MAKQKGTNIVALRKLFRDKDPVIEKEFLEQLSPELQRIYKNAVATTMTDVEKQTEIYQAAALILFPIDSNPLYRLGLEIADRSYRGIYKLFLRIPTPSFIITKAAMIWGTYYDKGKGSVEHITKNSGHFVLRDIPELPNPALAYIAGHSVKLLELAGAKNVQLEIDDHDSNCWRFIITWN